jgi:hypothetical protein
MEKGDSLEERGESVERTLIVLRGRANSGKTTTINLAWEQLAHLPGVTVLRHRGGWVEIRGAILEINGVLVGIVSVGDLARLLEGFLDELIARGCVVIVCATRSSGGTVGVIDRLEQQGWQVMTIEKDRNPAEDQERADEIVEAVLGAVGGAQPAGV